jgi:hypothetical protein
MQWCGSPASVEYLLAADTDNRRMVRWQMKLIIRDTWIRHGELDVGREDDRLVFERCTFMGRTVRVDPEVHAQIFVHCPFQDTCFTAQRLSPRIASECHWEPPNVEDAMPRVSVS